MHEVTESTSVARLLIKIPAARLTEVSNRAELYFHLAAIVVATIHDVESIGCFFLFGEFDIDMTYHMVTKVIANVKGFDASKLAEFFVEIFEEL